jgi:DNA-binding LytR/AlgR family response regulator
MRNIIIFAEKRYATNIRMTLKKKLGFADSTIHIPATIQEALTLIRNHSPELVILTLDLSSQFKTGSHYLVLNTLAPSERTFALLFFADVSQRPAKLKAQELHIDFLIERYASKAQIEVLKHHAIGCFFINTMDEELALLLERVRSVSQANLISQHNELAMLAILEQRGIESFPNFLLSYEEEFTVYNQQFRGGLSVLWSDVEVLELKSNYVNIIRATQPTVIEKVRKEKLLTTLPHFIIRAHRSFYVNATKIKDVNKENITLKSGKIISCSPYGYVLARQFCG